MEETIELTRSELIKAYSIWNQRYTEFPESFDEVKPGTDYSVEQADYLLLLLLEVKSNI